MQLKEIKKVRKFDRLVSDECLTIPAPALNSIVESVNEFLKLHSDVNIYAVLIRIDKPKLRNDGNIGIEFEVFNNSNIQL